MTLEEAYHILGVKRQASMEEVKTAYRRKALQLHPDRHASNQEKAYYAAKFQDLKEAYEFLKSNEGSSSVQESAPEIKPPERYARRSFSGKSQAPEPLFQKLGLSFSWNLEPLIIWGIVMPLAACVLLYLVRVFASIINP